MVDETDRSDFLESASLLAERFIKNYKAFFEELIVSSKIEDMDLVVRRSLLEEKTSVVVSLQSSGYEWFKSVIGNTKCFAGATMSSGLPFSAAT